MRALLFSSPGLGVDLAYDDAQDKILGGTLYARGYDGVHHVLVIDPAQAVPGAPYTYPVFSANAEPSADFPNTHPAHLIAVGTVTLSLAPEQASLAISFTLRRAALGASTVDFSPTPPPDVSGSAMLGRLA